MQTESIHDYSRSAIENVLGQRFSDGNSLKLLCHGTEAFDIIFRSLEAAKRFICLEFYIIRNDATGWALAEVLKRKAAEGVDVYMRYDHFGCLGTPSSFWKSLKDSGVRVRASRPFKWSAPGHYLHRNHRKLIVIDGEVSFTGGLNIGDEYRKIIHRKSPWRDTGIFMKGPISAQLYGIFKESWSQWGGEPILYSATPVRIKNGSSAIPIFTNSAKQRRRFRKLLYHSINSAKKSIHMTTAYFTPSKRLIKTLEDAVQRGVDVNLLLPGRSDSIVPFYAGRYFFSRLLKAGLKIHTYENEILHAKTSVFDSIWSIIGSSNLDFRSMRRNDEGNVGVLGRKFGSQMIGMFKNDLEHSRRINPAQWSGRPMHEKLQERFFVLFRRRL